MASPLLNAARSSATARRAWLTTASAASRTRRAPPAPRTRTTRAIASGAEDAFITNAAAAVAAAATSAPPALAPYAPSPLSAEDGLAQLFVCVFILVIGVVGMQTSLVSEDAAREAALEDKVRAQRLAMAGATQSACAGVSAVDMHASDVVSRLRTRGVVRVDEVLSTEASEGLTRFVDETLEANDATTSQRGLSMEVFGNVYCKKNRWDMKLPFEAPVERALRECVKALGEVLREACGADATLVELAALVSDPGSTRQPVHPDTAYRRDPTVYTCFVALQDVARDMGPTLFIPGTNNAQAHVEFRQGVERAGPVLERTNEIGVISRGDATLFDSRTLHCGTENESDKRRVLFYFSFQVAGSDNPNAAVSTIRSELRDKFTLAGLLS
jgi:ectoine hydroxylase-related dioxygenase (phytanoyl-CoA dioxygenase family)